MSVVRRNVLQLLLSQDATSGVSILHLVIAPSELGEGLVGEISFAAVYVSLFQPVALFGTAEFRTSLAQDRAGPGRIGPVLPLVCRRQLAGVGSGAVFLANALSPTTTGTEPAALHCERNRSTIDADRRQ